jgi:hypothetical protein
MGISFWESSLFFEKVLREERRVREFSLEFVPFSEYFVRKLSFSHSLKRISKKRELSQKLIPFYKSFQL